MLNSRLARHTTTLSFLLLFAISLLAFLLFRPIFSYENTNFTSKTTTKTISEPYGNCNYDASNVNASVSALYIRLNNNSNDDYNNQTLNNSSQAKLVFNEKSFILDLGCEPTIWRIDLHWNKSKRVQYNYTIEIADSNNITTDKIDGKTNFKLNNPFPSIEAENSIGRYVKVTLNEPKNMTISRLQSMTLHIYHPDVIENRTNVELWKEFNNDYPDVIHITNLTRDNGKLAITAPSKIFEIVSGDKDDILNPNFELPKIPVLNIGAGHVVSFEIDYPHIEGADVDIKIKDKSGKVKEISTFNLKEISYNDIRGASTTGIKNFYFLPYILNQPESPELKANYVYYSIHGSSPLTMPLEGNLTISFAPDSETSVFYKTKINITNN